MRWIEACIETNSGEIDGICAALEALGVEGVCIEDEADFKAFLAENRQYWDYVDEALEEQFRGLSRVKFYLSDDAAGRKTLEKAKTALGRELAVSLVDDADWESGWQENFPPLEIGDRLLVVPDWAEPEGAGRAVLRLSPGLAFGTGTHATTRMCLNVLDGLDLAGKRVLDLGCGSGILGLGALVLGAKTVTACDVDPKAPDAARANAALNGISGARFQVYAGDILSDKSLRKTLGDGYDVVLANIVADVIVALSSFVADFLTGDGVFICSGILDGRETEVAAALKQHHLRILQHLHEEEWHCYVAAAAEA